MIDWLSGWYLELILNYRILLDNPTRCSTVDMLRLYSLTLLGVFSVRLIAHMVVFHGLRRAHPAYDPEDHPRLWKLLRRLAHKLRLRRLPAVYRFPDERPPVFTIGSLRPAIFLAPAVMRELSDDELEAVLAHELIHIKRRDSLLLWLLEVAFLAIPLVSIQVFALSFIFSIQNSVYVLLGVLVALFLYRAVVYRWVLYLRELSCDDLSVDVVGDPLILASALVNVWRLGRDLPMHGWSRRLALSKSFLPPESSVERRVRRLTHYRRPRLKFLLGKAALGAVVLFIVTSAAFIADIHARHDDLIAPLLPRLATRPAEVEICLPCNPCNR